MNGEIMMMNLEDDEIISVYTRKQGIEDGILIDVTEWSKQAGISIPVAMTSNLYNSLVKPSEEDMREGQRLNGRMWDVFMVFRNKAQKCKDTMAVFDVDFIVRGQTRTERLWAVVDGGDDGNPVITIMLPEDY